MYSTYFSATNAEQDISTTRSDSISQTIFVHDQTNKTNDTAVSESGTVIIKSSREIEKERYSGDTFIVKSSDPGDIAQIVPENNILGVESEFGI